jgi:cytochrome c peroxidase
VRREEIRCGVGVLISVCGLVAQGRGQTVEPMPEPPRLLRLTARNASGYGLGSKNIAADVLLGDLLFHTPRLLGKKARALKLSCNSCHTNGSTNRAFFVSGISDKPGNVDPSTNFFNPGADDGVSNPVNIPSLRGIRFGGAPYGRDGRTGSLAEFINTVIVQEFAGVPPSPKYLLAIVRYTQEFDYLPNVLLTSDGTVTSQAGASAGRGELVFRQQRAGSGGMSCASCHVPSAFFRDGQVHRHGDEPQASAASIDVGYKTPTLFGLSETGPYWHDGRFERLSEVVDWYNTRYRLALSAQEKEDLEAYLAAVGAADTRVDSRPMGHRLLDTFAYADLICGTEYGDDVFVWGAALELILDTMQAQPVPPRVKERVTRAKQVLAGQLRRTESRQGWREGRSKTCQLREELVRLAADWAGALEAGR